MGRHHMKGGSECPWTDQQYRLEQISNITLFCQRLVATASVRQESYQEYSSAIPGPSGSRRRTCNSSRKIRWITYSTSSSRRLDPWWWGSEKWLLDDHRRIHLSSSQCTKSQIARAARRIVSCFRWITPTSPEWLIHPCMFWWRKILMITGTWMGERELSDAWTGFTRLILLNERPPDGYTWSGERLKRK